MYFLVKNSFIHRSTYFLFSHVQVTKTKSNENEVDFYRMLYCKQTLKLGKKLNLKHFIKQEKINKLEKINKFVECIKQKRLNLANTWNIVWS